MDIPERGGELSVTAQAALQEYRNLKDAEAEVRRAGDAWRKLERQITQQAEWKAYKAARAELERELRRARR
jgi:hypothetical protein